MNHKNTVAWYSIATLILAAAPSFLKAQAASPAPVTPTDDEEIVMSPFMVSASEGQEGYQATSTLAGSRVRTELKDLGTAISVVTKKLMTDIGATNSQTLLQFTTNTEVGGVRGNFAGLGNTATLNESGNLLRPNNNTRVRGLDAADNTRDYFMTEIPWDSYNVDRVEIQRGANSILFGLGSPAGIINTGLSGASYKNSYKFENRISAYGSHRDLLDLNQCVLKGELGVRLIGLDDHTKYRQKPAYNNDTRLYGALRYDPKWLKFEHASTTIRVNGETGNVKANRPRMLPPVDGLTQFFDVLGMKTYDSAVEDAAGGMRTGNGPIKAATDGYLARSFGDGMALRFNNGSSTPTSSVVGTIRIDPNAGVANDGSIGGLPFYRSMATTAYGYWAAHAGTLPGYATGFYKDKSLTDRSTFDYINNLIDGGTARQWQNWNSTNIAIDETLFDNRIAINAVYDYQRYKEGQTTLLNGAPEINVDVNSTIITGLTKVGGTANPNAGRAFIGGTGEFGSQSNDITRNSKRLTVTTDLRSTDILSKGFLTQLLGHHVITGLVATDKKETFNRQWNRFAGGIGAGSLNAYLNDPAAKTNDGSRVISLIDYVSGDLRSSNGISGLHLQGISNDMIPHSGTTDVTYFDTHWTATGVDPTAAWSDPLQPTLTRSQKDNPANYKGWTTAKATVLNADEGDIDALTYGTSKNYNKINSRAVTYQGFFWDGTFVGTFGYRKDMVLQKSGFGLKDPVSGVAPMSFDYDSNSLLRNSGESKSWSFVLHTPKEIRKKLPGNTDFTVFYNRSQNFKADVVRGDFLGNLLPNQTGRTKDYGFVISTLDDKLSLKVNWYDTSVNNATLGGESLLGANAWYLRMGEMWTTFVAAQSIAGLTQHDIANPGWAWDYAAHDLPGGTMDAGQWPRPAAAASIDAAQLASARAALKDMPGQGFWDNYGFNVNVDQVKKENFTSLLAADGKMNFTWAWQPAYGGSLKSTGSGPVVTVDTQSKGVEFEVVAQPTKNWNISINASKTNATRQNLSKTVESYIINAMTKYSGPAGELRLWGPGDTSGTLRANFMQNIYYPYLFLKSSEGSTASEIRPWRANLVSTYSFSSGFLKGVYAGGGLRWMQSPILGYGMLRDSSGNYNLDVNKVFRGSAETNFDMWCGYSHKLTTKIDWKIQLNLSNVGDKARLVPISVQPDGSPAAYRIADGMGWQITNTFSF